MTGKPMIISDKHTAEELETAAKRERDGRVRSRILLIRHLVCGNSIKESAGVFGIKATQIRIWVHRYNSEGLSGLKDRPRPGKPRYLRPELEEAFIEHVLAGPPPGSGLSAYRGEDLRQLLESEFQARYSLSGVYFLLARLGLSNLVPRPHHPDRDSDQQEEFKKTQH